MRTLFTGGPVRSGDRVHDWVLIDGNEVAAVGDGDDRSQADRRIDLENGILTAAFCDAHVHLPATGLYALGMDFRGERSLAVIRDAFAARATDPDAVLFGGNFEDPLDAPLDRAVLDEAVGERPALLARADMHSCVVSTHLLEELEIQGLEGVDRDEEGTPTGYLREQAASVAWRWFERNLPRRQLREAVRTALRLAASKGVTSVHEMFVVEWRGWDALGWFLDAVDDSPIEVVTYVGTDEVGRVKDLGFDRIGGDYFIDGSFGSHTAWMTSPYDPPPPKGSPPHGIAYRDPEDLLGFFMEAQDAALQVGVHAIGDAAIEQAISTWERVADKVGLGPVRALHHRIEHFECATDDHIERAVRLGLMASVQPAFDLYWGGEDGLYARRIGWDRARVMNRFKTMSERGLVVGAGSDSTVTPLDPRLQMQALRTHHLERERMDALSALEVHTHGGRALARRGADEGHIEPPARADLVWLDRDPVETPATELASIEVRGTWRAGRRIWPEAEEE
ncbi:MAG: amidohydrolase [Actinomycetota bacterium]